MNREIIFNFISQNLDFFKDADLVEMTICLFGEVFKNKLTKNVLREEQLYLYHVKLPRMYFKTKSMNLLDNGLLNFASDINGVTRFNYSDFTFTLKDPFYEKDVREFKFRYFYVIPIISKAEKVGVILAYCNNSIFNATLDNNSLSKLAINLTNNQEEMLLEDIKASLIDFDLTNTYYFINDQDNHKIVCSEGLVKDFGYDEVIHYDKSLEETKAFEELNRDYHLTNKKLSVNFDNLDVYYFRKNETFDIIKYYKTYKHRKGHKEFMVFIKGLDSLKKLVKEFLIDSNLQAYGFMDDYYFVILTNLSLVKKVSKFLSVLKPKYSILIDDLTFATEKMNFERFLKYLALKEPKEFDLNEYKQFIFMIGEDEYKASKEKLASSYVDYLGKRYLVINKPLEQFKFNESMNDCMKRIVSCVNKNLENDSFLISLQPEMIDTRKIKELFKKLLCLNKNVIIVLSDYSNNINLVLNAYGVIKQANFKLFVDSSIFKNFKMFSGISIIDGVYVNEEEFSVIQNSKQSLVNTIITYLFNEHKKIIFEKTSDDKKNNLYVNDNIYFVSKLI